MFKHTTKHHKDLTNDVRNYIDHIDRGSSLIDDRRAKIEMADSNRQLHFYVKLFRNHAGREDWNTALIMLAITRNKIYKYVAQALSVGVNFNIQNAAILLNDIEEYGETVRVKLEAQPKKQ